MPDLLAAIRASQAVKVYVCNIATQTGETDLYTCYDHVHALEEHTDGQFFNIVICNENCEGDLGPTSQWVRTDGKSRAQFRVFIAPT